MYPSSKQQNQGRLDSYEKLFSNPSCATAVRVHGLIKFQAMRGRDRMLMEEAVHPHTKLHRD
jgi:hypothetical protein